MTDLGDRFLSGNEDKRLLLVLLLLVLLLILTMKNYSTPPPGNELYKSGAINPEYGAMVSTRRDSVSYANHKKLMLKFGDRFPDVDILEKYRK